MTQCYADLAIDGKIAPALPEFEQLAQQQRVIPVCRKVLADGMTPVSVYHALADNRPGTFLLESAEQGGTWTRYSFIGVASAAALVEVEGQASWYGRIPAGLQHSGEPQQLLADALEVLATPRSAGLPPLTGGLVGVLGYDMVRRWERVPNNNPDELELPEICLLLATDVAVFDHVDGVVWLIANAINYNDSPAGAKSAHDDAVRRIERMTSDLCAAPASPINTVDRDAKIAFESRTEHAEYLRAVEVAKEHIRAGDAFQIVVSQRFDAPCTSEAVDVYRILRITNPSPYMYLLRMPNPHDFDKVAFDVVGSSPEALVKLTEGEAMLHPIAGTRPRGATPDRDQQYAGELLADEKERAEHLMLVDLGRNDLGRVCQPGTVEVVEFMEIERFSHVMHIVSTVVGQLRPDASAVDLLAATFPAGTLSGAPKPKAMEIIDALEPARRGLYAGCIGYFDFAGDLDTAIAIRTAVIRNRVAHIQAGAGIVADSDPESEYQECRSKAMAVLRAVAVADTLKSPR